MDGHNGNAQPLAYWPVISDRTRHRQRRRERGLSQDRLAFRSGVSLNTTQHAERRPAASCRTATPRQDATALSAEPDTPIRALTRDSTTTPDGREPRQRAQRRRDDQRRQRAKPFPAGRTGHGRHDIATAREPLRKAAEDVPAPEDLPAPADDDQAPRH
jgi:hypothetical protein